MISDNISSVRENILKASERSPYGQDVTLIAVSKTKPASDIMQAYECGIRDFGENKVQELLSKAPELPDDIRWHLIGHLQTNKVKQIIEKVYMIHSVDSLHLAETIEKHAAAMGISVQILIQVNISREETKFGLEKSEVIPLLNEISKMEHVKVCGLMTIAPFSEKPEEYRAVFHELKNLSIDIDALKIDNIHMDILSMGMSNDFITAIEEGSTMVRIGTDIFGIRNYNI